MINGENDKVESTNKTSDSQDFSQEEMVGMIDGVLTTLKSKFEDLSTQILSKMDSMSERMDEMEKSLVDLLESSANETTTDQDK